jgi:hypothetical protein
MQRMDEAREHLERVVLNRFNVLLVVLGAAVAGVVAADTMGQARLIFIVGAVLAVGLGLAVARAQLKADILVEKTLENPEHALTYVDYASRQVPAYHPGRYSPRKFLAYVLPVWISLFMVAGAAYPEILHHDRSGRVAHLSKQLSQQKQRLSQQKQRLSHLEAKSDKPKASPKKKGRAGEKRKKQ